MKALVPARFLRVRDKFVPDFLFEDTELSRGAGYLYVYLFSRSYHHGVCRVSQERLAHVGKCCVRSVQTYLKELVELQYLEVFRDPDSRCVYRKFCARYKEERRNIYIPPFPPSRPSGTSLLQGSSPYATFSPGIRNSREGGISFLTVRRRTATAFPSPDE